MKNSSKNPFWARLAPGLHRKRIGTKPAFTAFVIRGRPGPVALINAGTHGDEYEGPTVIREFVSRINPQTMRGTLVLIPVLHEDAFFGGTRCHPRDGSNLARVFPGRTDGNNAERVAELFLRTTLLHVDYYLDLHSGGVAYDLLPWCGYIVTGREEIDRVQADMTACFDDYWCWGSQPATGRTLSAAADAGVPAIYTESLGGGGVLPSDVQALERGLANFLIRFGFLPGPLPRLRRPRIRMAQSKEETHIQLHHPSPIQGLFIRAVSPGDVVRKGATLGVVYPLDRPAGATVKASHSGTIVSLRRQRSVLAGDALATIVELPGK